MKEHKNPKVLSEGILWMVSAVEDFGVSHIKLKVHYRYFIFVFFSVDVLVKVSNFLMQILLGFN